QRRDRALTAVALVHLLDLVGDREHQHGRQEQVDHDAHGSAEALAVVLLQVLVRAVGPDRTPDAARHDPQQDDDAGAVERLLQALGHDTDLRVPAALRRGVATGGRRGVATGGRGLRATRPRRGATRGWGRPASRRRARRRPAGRGTVLVRRVLRTGRPGGAAGTRCHRSGYRRPARRPGPGRGRRSRLCSWSKTTARSRSWIGANAPATSRARL